MARPPTHAKQPNKRQHEWRTAANCIDWSIPSKSIFNRKKPLADATLRRIAKGMQKFVLNNPQPFIVPIANWSGESVQSIHDPLRTVTARPRGGTFALASPVVLAAPDPVSFRPNSAGAEISSQLPTISAGNHNHLAGKAHGMGLCSAFIEQANGGFNTTPGRSMDEPLSTVTNTGSQQRLITASLVTLRRNCVGRTINDPVLTLTAAPNTMLWSSTSYPRSMRLAPFGSLLS